MATTFTPAGNAFEGIAPSASTSAASSSATKQPPYDVFINHRGPDVKKTLASSMYHALNGMGLRVFLDSQELELGDFLPEAIQEAMRTASLHIAIFSKNYAQSPWCLAELAFMLQTGTKIIPVFYHVQPDDVRWAVKGKRKYAVAFSEHEEKGRYTSEQLQQWKRALHKASFYSGDIINNEEDEQRVLKNIVNHVLKEMKKVPLEVAKHPVGLNEAVQEFEMTALQSAGPSHENVQIVGILGMGGSGKTTLAKELYNQKCSAMERSSFLFDLRDAAGKGKLHKKQKKLLEDFRVQAPSFDNVEQGKGILASRLRFLSVFMVLDDVDHRDQLDALLPPTDSLGRGSLIIVTTREADVLRSYGISAVYKMRALNRSHAKQLFCWHAFLQPSPLCGFEDLVEEFLIACHALPLSLKVLGGQLYGMFCKDYWVSVLDKILRILPSDIQEKLKVSYDALDEEEKEMFLDTACFFIGEENSLAIAVWDGSGWTGLHGWERLVNKCLVDLDEMNRIRMHDHLRDLGREIANRQSPYRLWFPGQIIHIQQQEKIRIRGMVNKIDYRGNFCRCSSEGKIDVETSKGVYRLEPLELGLKFLVGNGNLFYQDSDSESSSEYFPIREVFDQVSSDFEDWNLLSWPSLKNLRILDLSACSGLQELWEADADAPLQLRELVICGCPDFQRFPMSIRHLKHLKMISLDSESTAMASLPEEFYLLESLEHLELRGYEMLSSLVSRFGELPNLRHLDLSYCGNLLSLPSSFGDLTNLRHLDLSGCENLSSLPSSFGDLTNLRHLNLSICENLSSLPSSFGDLTNLRHLDLSNCENLSSLPSSFGDLTNLRHLDLSCCGNLSSLTVGSENDLESMTKLEYLNLSCCIELEEVPRQIANLASLKELYLKHTSIRELLANIGKLSKLEILEISSRSLTSLPTTLENLSSLRKLEIMFCSKLKSSLDFLCRLSLLQDLIIKYTAVKSLAIIQLINLKRLEIESSPIRELSFGPGCCKLKEIYLGVTDVSKISISEDCCLAL